MSVDRISNDHFQALASDRSDVLPVDHSSTHPEYQPQHSDLMMLATVVLRLSLAMACCLLSVFTAATASAQASRPHQQIQRGGVRVFDGSSSGVVQSAPGVREFGEQRPQARLAYYGIMGAVSSGHAATYSSVLGTVMLSQLVEAAQGLSGETTGMAQIVRNGRIAMQVFADPNVDHQLLPGDLVIFQRDLRQEQAPPDRVKSVRVASGTVGSLLEESQDLVEVAFVGILEHRPIIVELDRQYATVAHVVHAMYQHPDLAKTINVIRTDSRAGLIAPGKLPEHLVDGDVLLFDSRFLNQAGLSQAQEFPAAIPMAVDQPTGRLPDVQRHTAVIEAMRTSQETAKDDLQSVAESTPSYEQRNEPIRAFDEIPLPAPEFPAAEVEAGEPSIPFAPLLDTVESKITPNASVHQTSHDFQVVSPEKVSPEIAPVPQLEVPDLSATSHVSTPAPASELLDQIKFPGSADPEIESTVDPELSRSAVVVAQVDLPESIGRDLKTSSPDEDSMSQIGSLNTASIALAVLVLAALCFAVSIIWSRIDRTAQSLQQQLPSAEKPNTPGHRRTLDRLIENNLPIIEERAPFLKPSDFHGKEVGKRRLMIDPPQALAGPHFSMAASREQGSTENQSNAKTRALLEANGVESRLDRVVEHIRTFRRDEPTIVHKVDSERQATSAVPHGNDERPSKSGLLDRVLVAMERERRR